MTVDTARAAALKALEDAVAAFMALLQEQHDDYDDVMAVDAALVIGTQWLDEDGDRCGNVQMLPRHGSQPYYTTLGLLDGVRADILKVASGGG